MLRSIPTSLRPALEDYARRLRARFGDRLHDVRVFGSYARGDAHEDSDVDVLVVVEGLTDLEIGEAAGDVAPVIIASGLPIAPLPISTERLEALRRGERLFAQIVDDEGMSTLTEDNKRQGVAHALGHGHDARKAAHALRGLGLYNDALSRLYYALFHVMTALLLTEGIEPRRHRAVIGLLATHFGGLLSATDIAIVSRTATYRDLADYERSWRATAEVTDAAFAEVEPLVDRVLAHLASAGYG